MKEILTCDIRTGAKIRVVIDRETGELIFYNSRFKLDIQNNKAFLVDKDTRFPIFAGYLRDNLWCFKEHDFYRENQDPFLAAIQMVFDILQTCEEI